MSVLDPQVGGHVTITNERNLPDWLQPGMEHAMGEARTAYDNYQPNETAMQGYQNIADMQAADIPGLQEAQDYYTRLMNGEYLYGGDAFNAAQEAAYNRIAPQVQSAFGLANGSAALGQKQLTELLGDSFALQYGQERALQNQGLGYAGDMAQLAYLPDQMRIEAGLGMQGLEEKGLNDYINRMTGISEASGYSETSQQPWFENDLADILGTVTTGADLIGKLFGDDGIFSGVGDMAQDAILGTLKSAFPDLPWDDWFPQGGSPGTGTTGGPGGGTTGGGPGTGTNTGSPGTGSTGGTGGGGVGAGTTGILPGGVNNPGYTAAGGGGGLAPGGGAPGGPGSFAGGAGAGAFTPGAGQIAGAGSGGIIAPGPGMPGFTGGAGASTGGAGAPLAGFGTAAMMIGGIAAIGLGTILMKDSSGKRKARERNQDAGWFNQLNAGGVFDIGGEQIQVDTTAGTFNSDLKTKGQYRWDSGVAAGMAPILSMGGQDLSGQDMWLATVTNNKGHIEGYRIVPAGQYRDAQGNFDTAAYLRDDPLQSGQFLGTVEAKNLPQYEKTREGRSAERLAQAVGGGSEGGWQDAAHYSDPKIRSAVASGDSVVTIGGNQYRYNPGSGGDVSWEGYQEPSWDFVDNSNDGR